MDRAQILGCAIDRLDVETTVERLGTIIDTGGPAQHAVINAAKLVALRRDPRLREVIAGCALVNADGQSIVWASRLLGDPLPERVTGIDLMQRLLALAVERGYAVFILGAKAEVLERALRRLREQYPGLAIAGARDGYFTDAENAAVCAEIHAARPHILFVAMSSPRKEYWLADHIAGLGVPLAMGVGGAVDVIAGTVRRAPRWMQRAGLEWLFRVVQEPRRLASRYLVSNTTFLLVLAKELLASTTLPRRA